MRGMIIAGIGAAAAAFAGAGAGTLVKDPADAYASAPADDAQTPYALNAQQAWQPTEGAPPPYWGGPDTTLGALPDLEPPPLKLADYAPAAAPEPPVMEAVPASLPAAPQPYLPSAQGDILAATGQTAAPDAEAPPAKSDQPVDMAAVAP